MGVANSKTETCEPLRLCKERKKFMKQAIDSRYNLAAAHVVYIQSLHNLGIALGKLAETEVCFDSFPTQISTLNYMKSSGVNAVTVNVNPSKISNSNKVYVDDVESSPSPPLPPPMPPRFSWDYFDPSDGSFRLMTQRHDRFRHETNVVKKDESGNVDDDMIDGEVNGADLICKNDQIEQCDLKDETEDETEDVIYRGKDFVSSVKDIEDWFIRASKLGNEVSRMLEVNQIQISYSEVNGMSCFVSICMVIN